MDFGTVIWIVVLVIAPIAAVLFAGAFGLLDQLGRGEMSLDEPRRRPAPAPNSPAARAEREADIRQLVQARRDRALARGDDAVDVDVDAEVERLMALDPASQPEQDQQDAALREEVRQLVVARNERRAARGQQPLDVEAEIDRQLRDLG